MLEESERSCGCGLSISDSFLIDGWTIHRSQDINSLGRLYYVQKETNITTWSLPEIVIEELSGYVQQRLDYLKRQA